MLMWQYCNLIQRPTALNWCWNFLLKTPIPCQLLLIWKANSATQIHHLSGKLITLHKYRAPANSNETHEVKITGSGQYCQSGECTFWSANDNFLTELSLTATFTVADQPQSDKEITKKLKPSSIYGFEIWFEPLINGKGPLVKSGTTEEVDVYIGLSGNSNDAISKIDMSFRSCPQMDFNSENSGLVAAPRLVVMVLAN